MQQKESKEHKKNNRTKVLAIIGGGSTYTPELIDGLIRRENLIGHLEIRLMDIDSYKLSVVANFCRRILDYHKSSFIIKTFQCPEELDGAVSNADFIISQIRVGGHKARLKDLELGLKHDLIGQETTGAGGFASALRSIPVSLEIGKKIEKLAPKALLINFTNPSGIITQALSLYTKINVIGLCNIPWLMQEDLTQILGVKHGELELDYVGLNHFTWVYGARVKGENILQELISKAYKLSAKRYGFLRKLSRDIKSLPSPYLQYYYDSDKMLEKLKTSPSRPKEVMKIEKELLKIYQNPKLVKKPKAIMKRGGAYYGRSAAALLSDIIKQNSAIHIFNFPNGSRFNWLPPHSVIEAPWEIRGSNNITPVKMQPVPAHIRGMISTLKAYEELTVESAVKGDKSLAFQALLTNPLIRNARVASKILEDILRTNRRFLPQF